MKRILITGAYGLVGANICKILERDYPDIEITKVKFDELESAKLKILRSDISDEDYRNGDFFDYIIHAAGYGQPQMFSKDKIACIKINTDITDKLFSLLKKEGKFLFISTSEVYSGATPPHTEDMIGTTTPQHPRACYIEGKRCGEAICMAYREQGYDVKIARLALAYGPGTKPKDTRVLNQLIEKALTTGVINLMDSGNAIRTYCYIDDAVDLLLNILFNGTQSVYNVGGTSTLSIKELAMLIAENTKAKVILGKKTLNGSPDTVRLDMSKTLHEFPRSFIGIEEGIIRTINYQKKIYGKD